ncbi:MAG: hypothetical protein E7K67_12050 [Peptostreptococcaceae bacterium]|nr:hypothetical protein [Peptostreptococcaceae bacterium]
MVRKEETSMLEKIFGEGFSKQAKSDKVFDVLNYIGLAMILLLVLYPLYFIVIASFSSPDAVARGEVWLLPVDFSTEGYQRIFEYKEIWTGYWNSYFSALIYLTDRDMYPLQVILREILIQQQSVAGGSMANAEAVEAQRKLSEMIKYGVIIVSSLPVLCIYPFVQKHFVKGMMIGSVKG